MPTNALLFVVISVTCYVDSRERGAVTVNYQPLISICIKISLTDSDLKFGYKKSIFYMNIYLFNNEKKNFYTKYLKITSISYIGCLLDLYI